MTKGPYTNRRLARSADWSDTTLTQGQVVYDKTKESVRVGDGSTTAGRALALDNRVQIITPNQLGANTDNYSPTGLLNAGCLILSASVDINLTGLNIAAFVDGTKDRVISIAVDSSSPGSITLKDESANSSAVNRFKIGRDIKMAPGSIQTFRYRNDANRWVFFGAPATAVAFTPTGANREVNVQAAIDNLSSKVIHVESMSLTAPPVSPVLGAAYIVAATATGAWASQEGKIAVCSSVTGPTWAFITPTNDQSLVYNRAEGAYYRYTSSTWTAVGSGINDTSIAAIKLDTSTSAKQKDFREAIKVAPAWTLGAFNLFENPGFEGPNNGSAAAITLTASSTLQSTKILDRISVYFKGTFATSVQQVATPFVGSRYALKFNVTLAQSSMGVNDELTCKLNLSGLRTSKLDFGKATAQPISLGFWFQAHRTGTYSGSIQNKALNRSYPFNFTITTADTPQWISLKGILGDTSGTWLTEDLSAMYISICLAAGTSRVGTADAWAGSDYSGATSTTNGIAATTDEFYIGNVVVLAGSELPESSKIAFASPSRQEALRTQVQDLSEVEQAQARANLGLDTPALKRDLSHLLRYHGRNVVLTGDSLSFNAYDFPTPSGSPVNAYDFYPGMMSWSFMLRDFAHRADPLFEHAINLEWVTLNDVATTAMGGSAASYFVPFTSSYVAMYGFKNTDVSYFLHPSNNADSGGLVLHWFNNPNAGNQGQVNVYYSKYPYTTDTFVDTLTNTSTSDWGNFEPRQLFIPCGTDVGGYPIKILFKDFRQTSGDPLTANISFFISGIASKLTNFKLTGHGSYKASDILTDFSNRIGSHDPDLLIMIIGANDRLYGTKEEHAANLESIITATRGVNAYCEILIISPPPASDAGYALSDILNGSSMSDFLQLQKVTAERLGCLYLDCYDLFERVDPTIWRFDNVHFTKRGNKILFDAIIGRFFQGESNQPFYSQYYDPMRVAGSNLRLDDKKKYPMKGSAILTYAHSTQTYTLSNVNDPFGVLESVTKDPTYDYEVVCKFRVPVVPSVQPVHGNALRSSPSISPELGHIGGSGSWYIIRPAKVESNVYGFYLANAAASGLPVPTSADLDGAKFYLSW